MKKIIIGLLLLLNLHCFGQCPAGTFDATSFYTSFGMPTQPGIANENTVATAWGGDYFLFNVTTGNTYVFRTCFTENAAINTVLSLYNAAGSTLISFNDDFCGQQSQISWTATFTGQVRLSYYQSGCQTQFTDTKIGVYYTSPCVAPTVSTQPMGDIICNNYNTSFSVGASGTSPFTYQWQVNTGAGFANIANSGVYTNVTTNTLNITGATTTMHNYLYRCMVTNACGNSTSNSAALTVNATNNWTGAVNTDWHTAGNWSCGAVPSANDDIVISTGTPTIAVGNTAVCRNLSKSGFLSSINLNGATLQIYGNLNYSAGSINTNSTSSLQFKGAAQQIASGGTPINVSNMEIDNPNGLLMNKNIAVTNTLTLNQGSVFTNNFLLTANNISGATANKFIVTADASNVPATSGGLRMSIAAGGSKLYHVGPTALSYNPCLISNTNGPSEDFTVSVNNTALPGAPALETVQRTWQITENTVSGNTASLSFLWETAHEGANFNRNACSIFKSNGTTIEYTGYAPQNSAATFLGGTTWQKELTNITSFSPWGITSSPVILPVHLLDFSLQVLQNNNIKLNWEFASGSTVAYTELLKSDNGQQFNFIKKIEPNQIHQYSYVDEAALQNTSYYKLKIIDVNGSIIYSKILKSTVGSKNIKTVVYPNPVMDICYVQVDLFQNAIVYFEIFNTEGRKVFTKTKALQKGENNMTLDFSTLITGTYQLITTTNLGGRVINKIIKQ